MMKDLRNPLLWIANVKGKGKWKGKNYLVEIKLFRGYPRYPPDVRFKTP